jgi:hypothetical protein
MTKESLSVSLNDFSGEQLKTPFLLQNKSAYLTWRAEKLAEFEVNQPTILIENASALTPQEQAKLVAQCRKTNLVIYQLADEVKVHTAMLQALAKQLGLSHIDSNLCADEEGIAALQVAEGGQRQEYIPYTNRPLNWHTDGYYNTAEHQVRAVLLHCVRPAVSGGENTFLDHEIVYLKLRDENPAYISALMTPDVMMIPANVQAGEELRPAQTGPVFSINTDGTLHTRYTARARHIIWKEDLLTQEALTYLTGILNTNSPYHVTYTLKAGQGVLCNNVLHNRSSFTDGEDSQQKRLLYRIRFYDRISGT